MSEKVINVAMIGLGFGAEFIPIYQAHPNANVCAICRRDEKALQKYLVLSLLFPYTVDIILAPTFNI